MTSSADEGIPGRPRGAAGGQVDETRRRRLVIAVGVSLVLALTADVNRPARQQLTGRAAIGAIHLYQATLSPLYARAGVVCRFTPTCSHYGEAVIRAHGMVGGGWLALKRVVQCGPWSPAGTIDPPPP